MEYLQACSQLSWKVVNPQGAGAAKAHACNQGTTHVWRPLPFVHGSGVGVSSPASLPLFHGCGRQGGELTSTTDTQPCPLSCVARYGEQDVSAFRVMFFNKPAVAFKGRTTTTHGWRSARFRLLVCTHDAPPWGVRVDKLQRAEIKEMTHAQGCFHGAV